MQDSPGYKEGGALYALGLIHANHGTPTVINYLVEQLGAAYAAPLKHGACLGLGLTAMGTHDKRKRIASLSFTYQYAPRLGVYVKLREVLYTDDAVASMAAAYAMGLVYCGAHADAIIDEPFAEMMQVCNCVFHLS